MKKNLRKVPLDVEAKLKGLGDEIVAGCAVKFSADELRSGRLRHLGIELTPEGIKYPASVIPLAKQGKFSKRNVEGEEIIRRDLPKETAYTTVEAPNWGDSSNGTHSVHLPHERYPRDFISPRELEILIHASEIKAGVPTYIFSFKVNDALSKMKKGFPKLLLANLNLLQENVGHCGVESSGSSVTEYAKSLQVDWEVLPPGSRDEAVERLFRGRKGSEEDRNVAGDRYDFFKSLNPKSLVYGRSGFRRYFGALLEDDLVVFENIEYGNAVYVLFKGWQELSKRSRLELLSGRFGSDFERVAHLKGWKSRVREIVRNRRNGESINSPD